MSYGDVSVLADSMNPDGQRLTTLEIKLWRPMLAEFNTHKQIARNSASSRAVPVPVMIERIEKDPYIPRFSINQPGMAATDYLPEGSPAWLEERDYWLEEMRYAITKAKARMGRGIHKQVANRQLEPFMWHTIVATSDQAGWNNFITLRDHPAAQHEIQVIGAGVREQLAKNKPTELEWGEWHLPLLEEWEQYDLTEGQAQVSSTARCAAVSYNRQHDRDYEKERARFKLLSDSGHWSPFEHPAKAEPGKHAAWEGWKNLRTIMEQDPGFITVREGDGL